MNYISLFTGIGGFDLAFNRAGHHCVAMVERDKAAQAVLRARFPGVPLFDDVVTFGRKDIDGSVDIVVGGSPCQSFSVAGLRKSLGDDRGNLAFEFCRIVDEFSPRWVVWENVPGVLSTKDNAFGNFLAALVGEDSAIVPARGKWTNAGMVAGPARTAAWRVLDAQYFGVAQRRRRVFVVAGTGAERVAPVLFESEGVRRDSPPRRETRQGVAGTISGRIARSHTELDGHGAYVYQHASGGGDDFKDTAQALRSGAEHSYQVVYDARGNGDGSIAPNITGDHNAKIGDYTAVVVQGFDRTRGTESGDIAAPTLKSSPSGLNSSPSIALGAATVRRITPTECERLQAFPDGWTLRAKKPGSWTLKTINEDGTMYDQADTPRYKQLGNAVCVNVVEWIARRIP